MRAIQVKEYVKVSEHLSTIDHVFIADQFLKGPLDLQVTTLPTPSPSPSDYLIQIRSAGTNFFDLLQIQGKYLHSRGSEVLSSPELF